jgi:predicted DNA-binding transcriptional regulator AlpA
MVPQLFSIERTPPTLPVWETILQDLGNPPAHRVARALGVGRATVYRWNATGSGPRVACLALFWLTRWGRSEVDTQATNDAMLAVQLARALEEDNRALRRALSDQASRDSAAIAGDSRSHTWPGARPEARDAIPGALPVSEPAPLV